jgi:L-asparaginase II
MAVGAASHGGQPIHLAYVRAMLAEVGLDESALRCPPSWPYVVAAHDRLKLRGHARPTRLFHNCSGKHAAMLRACVAQGWAIDTYLDPDHPLQQAVRAELEAMTGDDLGAPAVDGCGAPVYSVTTRGVARAFARLGTDPEYRSVWSAMQRFAALTSDWGETPAGFAHWTGMLAKSGAEGLIGVSGRHDVGIAIRCWDGSSRPLGPALLATVEQLGLAPDLTRAYGTSRLAERVEGGGRTVGRVEAAVALS